MINLIIMCFNHMLQKLNLKLFLRIEFLKVLDWKKALNLLSKFKLNKKHYIRIVFYLTFVNYIN